MDAFVDLEVVVLGSDLERGVVVEDEGGTYELSAVEAIYQSIVLFSVGSKIPTRNNNRSSFRAGFSGIRSLSGRA